MADSDDHCFLLSKDSTLGTLSTTRNVRTVRRVITEVSASPSGSASAFFCAISKTTFYGSALKVGMRNVTLRFSCNV